MSASAVIAAYTRSPFTPANRGELAATRPDEIAGQVVKGLIDQAGIDPNEIENLILGLEVIVKISPRDFHDIRDICKRRVFKPPLIKEVICCFNDLITCRDFCHRDPTPFLGRLS